MNVCPRCNRPFDGVIIYCPGPMCQWCYLGMVLARLLNHWGRGKK